jgi:nucleoside-diphosphate-sugar epimerase
MKILIIGNGFLGSAICKRLESDGHEILVFARTWRAGIKSQQVLGDIFDFEEFLRVLIWKPQVIVHTAWLTTPGIYRSDSSNTEYANFTINLARSLANSDVEHFIALGTCAEYGHQDGPSAAGQTTLSPTSLYAQQKVLAFRSTRDLLRDTDVRFTWVRIFYPYGPNQNEKRLIPRLINAIKRGESFALSDTSSIYDWITTRDIACAISWILAKELPEEIDVGTSVGFTNLELMKTLEMLLQRNHEFTSSETHDFGLNEVFVVSKDSPLLTSGWMPSDSLIQGLEWTLGR